MAIESYAQALAFWFGRINYETRGMPADLRDLKLDRMRTLLELLGRPQDRLHIIHIAGSKGKGSTAAMLDSILSSAGFRTGLFTSPHLTKPEERIQVDGVSIPEAELTVIMRELESACDNVMRRQGTEPTFFEVATALGLIHFVRRRCQWAVLEVGLGGRFDSTNVCDPEVAVITSISLDHQEQLGNDTASIAMEKAGIIKAGRPVVSGVIQAEPREVIERICRERSALLRTVGKEIQFAHQPGVMRAKGNAPAKVQVSTWRRDWPWMMMGLLGGHQAVNAAVAVGCVEILREQGVTLNDESVTRGLADVRWPARMETLRQRPIIVLDCAHNLASVEALLETLRESFPRSSRTLVFGGSRDKDLIGMLALLSPHFDRVILTPYASSQRSATAVELRQAWDKAEGGPVEVASSPADAWRRAKAITADDGLICITGSVFLAGELRPLILAENSGSS